jgi:hypothetical protein
MGIGEERRLQLNAKRGIVQPVGAPFDSKADSDVAMFGRSFVTGRDRRAASKAARLATRR